MSLRPIIETGPRGRVLRHMRRLLKASAVGGAAALGLGALPACVSDPLPNPMDRSCDPFDAGAVALHLSVSAQWVQGDAGSLYGSVELDTSDERIWFGAPQLTGATLLSADPSNLRLVFAFAPDVGATTVVATIPVECDRNTHSVVLRLDVSGGRMAGNAIPGTLSGT